MIMVSDAAPQEPAQETPDTTEPAAEFMNVPIDLIQTGPQIRTDIDPQGEAIRSLAETIRERGMIQPLTVVRSGDGYFLITGERRLLAARFLGLAAVPVRILAAIERQEDVLSLQLIENLQREDLNPIDMAEGLRSFFQARQGKISLDKILNTLLLYDRDPERLPDDIVATVATIAKISGKSTTSLKRVFALLKLPGEIEEALRTGKIGVSQGYLFADYLDNPELIRIFNSLLANPVTNEKLKTQLEAFQKKPQGGRPKLYRPFRGIYAGIKAAGATVGDAAAPVTKEDLTKLLEELKALAAQVKTRLQAIP